jgi:hypothetical protein
MQDDTLLRFVNPIAEEDPNLIFVAMPFSPVFDTRFDKGIREPLEEDGYHVVRTDRIFGNSELIMNRIIRHIQSAFIVVADITGSNPNVLLELGLALGFGKRVILIAERPEEVPADLRYITYLQAGESPEHLSLPLKNSVRTIASQNLDLKSNQFLELTNTQRIVFGARYLGIVDVLPAKADIMFEFAFRANRCIDVLGLAGRMIFEMYDSPTVKKAIGNSLLNGVEISITLPAEDSKHSALHAKINGGGLDDWSTQVRLGASRFTDMGACIHRTQSPVTWGGVIVDKEFALVQMFVHEEWRTRFLKLKNVPQGIFTHFETQLQLLKGDSNHV